MALPIRTRPSFPHSQSLHSRSFHKPLTLVSERADKKGKKNHRQLIKLISAEEPEVDAFYEDLLEKGMANHFSILALRTP